MYEIFGKLGSSRFGTLEIAKSLIDNKLYAYKHHNLLLSLRHNETQTSFMLVRFLREIKIHRINHPNIVEIKEAFLTPDGDLITISELADRNIANHVKQHDYLPPKQIAKILLHISQGLYYIHKKGMLHRRISPENILVFSGYNFKISGLEMSSNGKTSMEFDGKRRYMAPEI